MGFPLAAAAVYSARHGTCDGEERSSPECRQIARQLKARYGETLSADEVLAEMRDEPQ